MSEMKMTTLKNGKEEAEVVVATVMMTLNHLITNDPICFYELVMKCRDANHEFFGKTGDKLKRLGLVEEGGSINNSIKNIVVSAVTGEDFNMVLGSPIGRTEKAVYETLHTEDKKEETVQKQDVPVQKQDVPDVTPREVIDNPDFELEDY